MDRQRNRVCLARMPSIPFLRGRWREIGVYSAGGLFAIGWWLFLSSCILSAKARPPADSPYEGFPVHVRFADWLPGLFGTVGMIIVNLLDKQRLMGDEGIMSLHSSGGAAWRARLFLFLGFALMAGGLAGSITILVIKYIIPQWPQKQVVYWGLSNVAQNVLILLSATILWIAQNSEQEYEYIQETKDLFR